MNFCKIKNCPNYAKCIKHCEENAGYALYEFLTNVDVVETQIGDFRSGKIVSGIMLENLSNPAYILSPLETSLSYPSKFLSVFGKAPLQILKVYTNKHCELEEQNALKAKLKGIISNKYMVIPIKPRTQCKVMTNSEEKNKFTELNLEYVKWHNDPNTMKFECELISEPQEAFGAQRRLKVKLTDYGKKFMISSIEGSLRPCKINRNSIQITDFGFIRPVIFKDKKNTLAIDGTYLYRVTSTHVEIAGVWGIGDSILEAPEMKDLHKSQAYKELMENINYISKHKRFLVPYGFTEASVIDVSSR